MHLFPPALISLALSAAVPTLAAECKITPNDAAWPSLEEWSTLNTSIGGTLLRTAPAGSSCYPGNPFHSPYSCLDVKNHWSYALNHSQWPESIDYSAWGNNSCLPPGVSGYTKEKGCSIGGLPQYIVNATSDAQVAAAMNWASKRGIRITVKSTGHDLNGRSTGAYALSIWTRNFNNIHHSPAWNVPGTNETADVLICGGGNNWGSVYTAAHRINRTVVGGEDATVGIGGLIQNGGHGLLSSHYGLASDSVRQVTVVTTEGHRLVANSKQNRDIFWAVRGGGGGQFGVVTEFVLETHPLPTNVVTGGLAFYPGHKSNASEKASWDALAETAAQVPDLMDSGILGTIMSMTGQRAVSLVRLNEAVPGASVVVSFISYNSTTTAMNKTLRKLASDIAHVGHGALNISLTQPSTQSYWSYTKPNFLSSQSAGSTSLFTSHLLGRSSLSDLPREELAQYLQDISVSGDAKAGSMLLFGLQGGKGPASIPEENRGSTLPAWRSAYAHVMSYGAPINETADPSEALSTAAEWIETHQEPVWRNWAPNSGAYMNEGNPFTSTWKHDFYGENYDRLLEIKRKYDPTESLFVWSGVGSDMWRYGLHSGLLCRVQA